MPPGLRFVSEPSAEMGLSSWVTLCCAVSYYVHRRQALDAYQTSVFLAAAFVVSVAAIVMGASRQVVLLAYVPWAACAAMAASCLGHILLRQLSKPKDSTTVGPTRVDEP